MKILWLSNIALPEASRLMGDVALPYGGWMVGAAKALTECGDVQLSVAFPKKKIRDVRVIQGEKITYYAFPYVRERKAIRGRGRDYLPALSKILDLAAPDIVPIFGTEYVHSLPMTQLCAQRGIPATISCQGFLFIYAAHFMANLPLGVQHGHTLREWLYPGNLHQRQKAYVRRGLLEMEALRNVRYIIGRTTWDKACALQTNPDARYYHCNEILREEFYKHTWDLQRCERFSIFLSQCNYPIKGLHLMLEALPLILRRFPQTKVYVAGPNLIARQTLKECLKQNSYSRYIRKLITKYGLEKNVEFTGTLDERQMCERFLKTHIFVSPSTVENESNSLSEAKLLGVPCVASYVGGVVDRIEHGKDGFFYAWDAPYMLAHYVCEIFASDDVARTLSENARHSARRVNDPGQNLRTLLEAYTSIFREKL